MMQQMQASHLRSGLETLTRGGALFLGGLLLLSYPLSFAEPIRYDATIWWVDLRFLPSGLGTMCSLVFGFALLHRAVWPQAGERVVRGRRIVLGLLFAVLVLNTLATWRASLGEVSLGTPIPLTAVLAVCVGWMWRSGVPRRLSQNAAAKTRRCAGVLACACACALLAAVGQMVSFGESDYRRSADAILVYGCKAYADGTPSQALADRVHTAAQLYHEGHAPLLVISGGPIRDSDRHETEVMADYAESLGVPREAIRLDREGWNTQATADHLGAVLGDVQPGHMAPRILAVSHDYHLPRVKLTLERRGLHAYTVPAEIRRGLPGKPYFMARETVAWWVYFFRPAIASLTE
jgi:uncharacterized SAM-binding protein YcdF (DUF218 family)